MRGGKKSPYQTCAEALADDFLSNGVEDDFRGIVQIEFLHQMHSMGFDGIRADLEQRGYFFIGVPFGQQLKHFSRAR